MVFGINSNEKVKIYTDNSLQTSTVSESVKSVQEQTQGAIIEGVQSSNVDELISNANQEQADIEARQALNEQKNAEIKSMKEALEKERNDLILRKQIKVDQHKIDLKEILNSKGINLSDIPDISSCESVIDGLIFAARNGSLDKIKTVDDAINFNKQRIERRQLIENNHIFKDYANALKDEEPTIYKLVVAVLKSILDEEDPSFAKLSDEDKNEIITKKIGDLYEKIVAKDNDGKRSTHVQKELHRKLTAFLICNQTKTEGKLTISDIENLSPEVLREKVNNENSVKEIENITIDLMLKDYTDSNAKIGKDEFHFIIQRLLILTNPQVGTVKGEPLHFNDINEKEVDEDGISKREKCVQNRIKETFEALNFWKVDFDQITDPELSDKFAKFSLRALQVINYNGLEIDNLDKPSLSQQKKLAHVTRAIWRNSNRDGKSFELNQTIYSQVAEIKCSIINQLNLPDNRAATDKDLMDFLEQKGNLSEAESRLLNQYRAIFADNPELLNRPVSLVTLAEQCQEMYKNCNDETLVQCEKGKMKAAKIVRNSFTENKLDFVFNAGAPSLIGFRIEAVKDVTSQEEKSLLTENIDKSHLYSLSGYSTSNLANLISEYGTEEKIAEVAPVMQKIPEMQTKEQTVICAQKLKPDVDNQFVVNLGTGINRHYGENSGNVYREIVEDKNTSAASKAVWGYTAITTSTSADQQLNNARALSCVKIREVTEGLAAAESFVMEDAKKGYEKALNSAIEHNGYSKEEVATIQQARSTGKISQSTLEKTTPAPAPKSSFVSASTESSEVKPQSSSYSSTSNATPATGNRSATAGNTPVVTSQHVTNPIPQSENKTFSPAASSERTADISYMNYDANSILAGNSFSQKPAANNTSVEVQNSVKPEVKPIETPEVSAQNNSAADVVLPKSKEELLQKLDNIIEHINETNITVGGKDIKLDDKTISDENAKVIAEEIIKGTTDSIVISDLKNADKTVVREKLVKIFRGSSLGYAYNAIASILGTKAQDLFISTIAKKANEANIMSFAAQISEDEIVKLINECPDEGIRIRLMGLVSNKSKISSLIRKILLHGNRDSIKTLSNTVPEEVVKYAEEISKTDSKNTSLLKTLVDVVPFEYQGRINAILVSVDPNASVQGSAAWRKQMDENQKYTSVDANKPQDNQQNQAAAASANKPETEEERRERNLETALDYDSLKKLQNSDGGMNQGFGQGSNKVADWKLKGSRNNKKRYNNSILSA